MKIEPIGKNIYFEPLKDTLEGIAKIAYDEANAELGTVIEIGPEVKQTKIGDFIMFKGYGVTKVEYSEKTYYFVREDDYISLGVIKHE